MDPQLLIQCYLNTIHAVQLQIGGKKGMMPQGTLLSKSIGHWGKVPFVTRASEKLCGKPQYNAVPKNRNLIKGNLK